MIACNQKRLQNLKRIDWFVGNRKAAETMIKNVGEGNLALQGKGKKNSRLR